MTLLKWRTEETSKMILSAHRQPRPRPTAPSWPRKYAHGVNTVKPANWRATWPSRTASEAPNATTTASTNRAVATVTLLDAIQSPALIRRRVKCSTLTPLYLAYRVRKGFMPFACVKETSGAITPPPRQSWTLDRVRTATARFGVGYDEGCAGCATWLGGPLTCVSHRIYARGGFTQSSTDLRLLALDEAVDLVESILCGGRVVVFCATAFGLLSLFAGLEALFETLEMWRRSLESPSLTWC